VAAALAVAAAVLPTACGGDDDAGADSGVRVSNAWARATPGGVTVGAVYLRATSDVDDQLIGATVAPGIAASVELHTTASAGDGTATMEQHDALAGLGGGELVLEPFGNHLMLVGLAEPLTSGRTFDVTLQFATAGAREVEVEVREDAP
jgi:copper(I)-binding protein